MSATIAQYFDEVEARLIASKAVVSYRILRREITPLDGKLRVKVILSDGGVAELFEYVVEIEGRIITRKYSFHWQDAQEKLVCRWDNAPHHLSHHHLHKADGTVIGRTSATSMLEVITEIENLIS